LDKSSSESQSTSTSEMVMAAQHCTSQYKSGKMPSYAFY